MFYGNIAYRPYLDEPPTDGEGFIAGPMGKKAKSRIGQKAALDARKLKKQGTELYLNKNYTDAITVFGNIVEDHPQDPCVWYALNSLDNCFRRMRDYRGAVEYFGDLAKQYSNTPLGTQLQFRQIYHLKKSDQGQRAYNLAMDDELLSKLSTVQREQALIEGGLIQKYYLDNVNKGHRLFRIFMDRYPRSRFAVIATTELGLDPPIFTTDGGPEENLTANPALPQRFALHQNYPNPFNPATTIRYDLPEIADVSIKIYNIRGQHVATLVDRREAAGFKMATWGSVNHYGRELSSGVYILQMIAQGKETGKNFIKAEKLVMIK
jgi:tetratricopeptide (TPR) repeat protein